MNLYFNAKSHKYTDDFKNPYISATTIMAEYSHKFSEDEVKIAKACERIGRNPHHPKYKKYVGKNYKEILAGWKAIRDNACEIGTKKHDFLDTSVKKSNGFFDIFGSRYNISETSADYVKLFTINDIKNNPNVGKLNLDYFIKSGIKDLYPQIFNIIKSFINDGWNVYSEVGVFDVEHLISGQIDIIFIKGTSFVILDWKTNKDDIKFESGYWDKDINGKTTNYIFKDKYFKKPISYLPDSVGNKYSLQLSMYDYLVELSGYKFVQNILCHIKHDNYDIGDDEVQKNPELLGKNKIKIIPIKYMKKEIELIINDYVMNRTGGQLRLM